MTPRIELIYDSDCPNVLAARQALRKALSLTHLPGDWQEWERSDSASPAYARDHGSPTILVNGQDIDSAPTCSGSSCRVYATEEGHLQRVPPLDVIQRALTQSIKDPAPTNNGGTK